jgi:O-antigen/teichoic acid export membrane protein
MPQNSLLKAAMSAGAWTLAGHGSSQVLRLVSNLLLTRLLAPEFFGVMSVATVISVAVVMFSDLGLRQVIVRSPRAHEPKFVNTVWTLQILQSLAMALLLLAVAGGIAYAQQHALVRAGTAYASADLPFLVAGLALGAIVNGLESTRLATAEKELFIRPVVMIELGSQIAGLAAMCAVALVHPSIYVLLVGALASGVAKVAASHLLPFGVPNRLEFSREVAGEVCRISQWIVVSSAFTFLATNLDKLLLASLLDADAMGQYVIAALLVGAVNDVVARVSSRVAYPAITSAYERDSTALVRSYYQARMPMDAFCLIAAAILFWFGPRLVALLYDQRYAGAGTMLGILAISLVGSRYSIVPYLYLLLGRTGLMAAEQGIRLAGLLVAIWVGYRFGGTPGAIYGVALGQLAGSAAGLFVFQPRLGLLSIRRELAALVFFFGTFGLFAYASH